MYWHTRDVPNLAIFLAGRTSSGRALRLSTVCRGRGGFGGVLPRGLSTLAATGCLGWLFPCHGLLRSRFACSLFGACRCSDYCQSREKGHNLILRHSFLCPENHETKLAALEDDTVEQRQQGNTKERQKTYTGVATSISSSVPVTFGMFTTAASFFASTGPSAFLLRKRRGVGRSNPLSTQPLGAAAAVGDSIISSSAGGGSVLMSSRASWYLSTPSLTFL